MNHKDSLGGMRRGTKSCVECRRRKLRCSWGSERSERCRRCEERDLTCAAQTPAPKTAAQSRSSKERITQLEAQVRRLGQNVSDIQSKLGESSDAAETWHERSASYLTATTNPPDEDRQDTDSSSEDDVVANDTQPRLKDLFQNEWLSTDPFQADLGRNSKSSQGRLQLLSDAKRQLQVLIPAREDVALLAQHVSGWSRLVAEMFPASSFTPSPEDTLSKYDNMNRDDCNTWDLASWMLALALTAQQVPQEADSPGALVQSVQKRYAFAKDVTDTIERSLLSHDSLLGTIEGLGIALNFLRATLTRGHMQRTWLYLRRVVAIAELMGLPRVAKAAAGNSPVARVPDLAAKTRMWASICTLDRLSGLLNNLPLATRLYNISPTIAEIQKSTVNPINYVLQLSDVAVCIQDLDDLRLTHTSSSEIHAAAVKLDSRIRTLTSTIPAFTSPREQQGPNSWQVLQFLTFCVLMQTHLPFVLSADPSSQFGYCRMAGIRACQDVAYAWRSLRQILPFGFFVGGIIDVQMFTATVVLMLLSTSKQAMGSTQQELDEVSSLLAQNIELLEDKSREPFSAEYTRQAAKSLRSLKSLLVEGHPNESQAELVVRVPLLGKVRVKRRQQSNSISSFQHLNTHGVDQRIPSPLPQTMNVQYTDVPIEPTTSMATQQPFDFNTPLWMVEEDYGSLFPDYTMNTGFDEAYPWQAGFNDVSSGL